MIFSLTVLGSSSALPTENRFPTAHVLNVHERFFLIDCGEGTQIQLKRFGNIKYSKLNNIFISHLHGDHIFGLFGLISSLDLMGRTADLNIYAHIDLKEILDNHLKYFGENMSYKIVFHPVNTFANEVVHEDHCMTVETIPLKHRVPACGYLFREKTPPRNIYKELIDKYKLSIADITRIKNGENFTTASGEEIPNEELTYLPYRPRSYAFCSDTMYSGKVADIVKGVDLLYHEATFLDDMQSMARQTGHSTTTEAGEIALKADVKRLLIGHFSSRYDNSMLVQFQKEVQQVFPNSDIVVEGETYEIPLEKKCLRNTP
ncbi:MAG: ribonuclease Z [Prevotellaceae bacterium]|jgi:ribonuclease Z|nr:ribonuclease Z [Prevotellaceae bacterium]